MTPHHETPDHPPTEQDGTNPRQRPWNSDGAGVGKAPSPVLHVRNRYFLLLDFVILCVTATVALFLRVDSVATMERFAASLVLFTVVALIIRLVVFYRFELYRRYWRYASVEELVQIAAAVLVSTMIIVVVVFGVRIPALGICERWPVACGLPRSIPFIDALLVLLAVGGVRFSLRLYDLWTRRAQMAPTTRRVLVVGAGDAGALIVKEMRANPQLSLNPVGFVDDNPQKLGARIHSVRVLGNRQDIPELVREQRVDEVIIAMPTASGKVIRDVVKVCEQANTPARTMPGIYELLGGTVSVNELRTVQIEDLLRREPVWTDTAAVEELIRGRRVLITGAGGSIGGELCRQVLRFEPAELILLGHGENSIFEIHGELLQLAKRLAPSAVLSPVIVDVRFVDRLQQVMQQHRPHIIFHAAAHKHVPLMEQNPAEAVSNNILGARNLLRAALDAGVERFVMISSDKAVNPTSIMGATKRATELLVMQAAQQSGRPYVAVRFGNVLGSRGSVVLTFKRQIASGGPVTITHPDMDRFFMTIPEAVQLVLQAAALGSGGEVFVLDMGEPVKIVDLATDLIELSGLEVGRDIDIVYTGLRPGEKLSEELFVAGESYGRTLHEKIFTADNASSFVPDGLDATVDALALAALKNDRGQIIAGLSGLIPEYRPMFATPGLQPAQLAPVVEQSL